ncbi:hypothetical protein H6768_02260 [Candidatus Peribacteria bacterium]|nr:hypothetical protein [Candidatus Peribacteria bacterium]
MKKNLLISFSLVLILVVGMVFLSRDDSSFEDVANTPANVYIQNGVQYVVINARA